MRRSAYNIAVCAMFGALQLIFVVCAKYVEILTLSFYVLCACAMMFPITKKMYKESILTFIAVSILSFFIGLVPECIIYAMISGGYTLLSVLLREKKVHIVLSYAIKIAWTILSFFVLYIFFKEFVTIDLSKFGVGEVPLWVYPLVVAVVTIVYDVLLKYLYSYISKLSDKIFKN